MLMLLNICCFWIQLGDCMYFKMCVKACTHKVTLFPSFTIAEAEEAQENS